MHVVLSGYYGFNNVGDEAILYSIIFGLKRIHPEIKITVLSNHPESTEKAYQVHAVNRHNLYHVHQVLKKADGLISGGGSLLQDVTGMKSIPYYLGIILMAKWHRVPVFIYAQGIGPIKSDFNKWMVKKMLGKVKRITVRDNESKEFLKNIGIEQTTTIVPDPVLGLDKNNLETNWETLDEIQRPFISVSVRDWPTNTYYKNKLAFCLDQLAEDGYSIVFVPMHGKVDDKSSKETARLMNEKSYIAPANASIEEKIAIIGQSELLIGIRLHSLIFAAINYVPFVAISYDPKIDAFASICEQPVAGHIESDDWDGNSLWKQVTHHVKHKSLKQDRLKNIIQKLQHEAQNTPKMALQSFADTEEGYLVHKNG